MPYRDQSTDATPKWRSEGPDALDEDLMDLANQEPADLEIEYQDAINYFVKGLGSKIVMDKVPLNIKDEVLRQRRIIENQLDGLPDIPKSSSKES